MRNPTGSIKLIRQCRVWRSAARTGGSDQTGAPGRSAHEQSAAFRVIPPESTL